MTIKFMKCTNTRIEYTDEFTEHLLYDGSNVRDFMNMKIVSLPNTKITEFKDYEDGTCTISTYYMSQYGDYVVVPTLDDEDKFELPLI